MQYGAIVGQTFQLLWREKRLWLFGIVGVLFTVAGVTAYYGFSMTSMQMFMASSAEIMANPLAVDDSAWGRLFGPVLVSMLGGVSLILLMSLLGYIINLFMRGATIDQAREAWEGHPTDFSAGVRAGVRQSARLFLLDMLWSLPGLLIAIAVSICAIAAMVGGVAAIDQDSGGGVMVFMASFIGLMCTVGCAVLLIYVARALFAPMMTQSLLQRQAGLGAAIRDGWNLSRNNLGAMLIFALVMLAGYLAVYTVMQVASLPLSFFGMGNMMVGFNTMLESPRAVTPQIIGGLGVLVGTLIYGLGMLLATSFYQSYGLVMYAQVYRELTMGRKPELVAVDNAAADAVTPAGQPDAAA